MNSFETVNAPHADTVAAATAIRFVNNTSSHIFLTGKAGTGKTTFLKNLSARAHKQLAIVAPTGIAALNAGGVTIHSQFLLPLGMFLPEQAPDDFRSGNFYNADTLARKHPLNSARKQVLRSLDLLIIDEVSMLRSDLLDAIDYRMKAAKGNFKQSFGGVQLLLIGDLYQLPPVVKREEEAVMRMHYDSPWFFNSKALKRDGFVYIELDKIFRQQDDAFIDILNNLRNNNVTVDDIHQLNKHYKTPEEIQHIREVITLTTHNYKADDINICALNALETSSYTFTATISGDFPESMYPVQQKLELKIGAQIMFTKNDTEGKVYFNGKLATVTSIEGSDVIVNIAGSSTPYTLKKATWENKRYTVDPVTREIDDEVIGTFEQYPVKLAWAITVHKSQGLTFDKAVIDVAQAFADGQVYVALSRLRSLDGLILSTPVERHVISTDKQVAEFTHGNNRPDMLPVLIKTKQAEYIRELIDRTFDFHALIKECNYIQRGKDSDSGFEEQTMKPVIGQIMGVLKDEGTNTEKFRRQLHTLLESNDTTLVLERLKKGSGYYTDMLIQLSRKLLHYIEETRQRKRVKGYLKGLEDIDQLLCKKLEELGKVLHLTDSIFTDTPCDFSKLASERASLRSQLIDEIRKEIGITMDTKKKDKRKTRSTKKQKKDGRSTYDITLDMLKSGMSVDDIARERGMVVGTIEGHLARAVGANALDIRTFMSENDVKEISSAIQGMPEGFTSKDLFVRLNGKFGYGQLRAVMNHLSKRSD